MANCSKFGFQICVLRLDLCFRHILHCLNREIAPLHEQVASAYTILTSINPEPLTSVGAPRWLTAIKESTSFRVLNFFFPSLAELTIISFSCRSVIIIHAPFSCCWSFRFWINSSSVILSLMFITFVGRFQKIGYFDFSLTCQPEYRLKT